MNQIDKNVEVTEETSDSRESGKNKNMLKYFGVI